jgi:signal transduction histidine kinase/DNA-binding response OmpR family regulator
MEDKQNRFMISEDEEHVILIVDDNPMNLGVLSNYLKGYGFRILVARSGESTLKKAMYVKPDIILLDVMMGGIDGFETCRQLKKNNHTKDIPVIFMTALSETQHKVKGFEVGAVDYVTKPLQHEEVLARVSVHLNVQDLTQSLKKQNARLQDTTEELKEANTILLKRTLQLSTTSQVGQKATSILDLDELLEKVAQLIQSQFQYYFVGVWLLNKTQDAVVLQTYAGDDSINLTQESYQILIHQKENAIIKVFNDRWQQLIENIDKASTYPPLTELPKAQSELILPLRIGVKSIGVLDIISLKPAAFNDEDKVTLRTMADQIAPSIRNAQIYKAEQHRRQLSESLEQTGRVLSSSLDLHEVPGLILNQLTKVVPYERGLVMLQRENKLNSVAHHGFPDKAPVTHLKVTIHSGDVFERLKNTHQPVLVDDVTKDPGWQQQKWLPLNYSWLGVPLIAKNRVIGMISLTRADVAAFSQDDATLVLAFAAQAAIALENAALYDEINQLKDDLELKVIERTEELNKAYHLLEKLNNTKTDFIKVASHELRTPLAIIKGYSQLLAITPTPEDDEDDMKELADGIVDGVNRLDEIVNMMFDVAKVDANVLEMDPTFFRVEGLLRNLSLSFREDLQKRELSLSLNNLSKLPTVEGDETLLFKVFYNLIINAIKYTPNKGSITLSGHLISQVESEQAVKITISDTGIGIDPEHHTQIFEKFYQTGEVGLHSTGKTKFKGGGPGLGLAVVKGIVEGHGGKVWVESEKHDEAICPGSHFHVVLPVKQPAK